ncbi:hypothetical protein [Bacillus anthracis]|uniref:hypothetical protein n=1 Tax=Bacillus anthracis TaxID=1392 RepID=UPI000BF26924|nr:hypothetical protein [Bacillus anthracis]PGB56868.1 hypothetical protein COL95_02370 [Bacillus anthracis]
MNVWKGKEGRYKYTIKEREDGYFDLTVDAPYDNLEEWFPSYRTAREFLKREYYFTGRMKQIS